MPENTDFREQADISQEVYLNILEPIEREIRVSMKTPTGIIDCIEWSKRAGILLDNYADQIPDGTQIYHCVFDNASDPHQWIELEFPISQSERKTYIWDDSQQKIKNKKTFIQKHGQTEWSRFADSTVGRQIIYPDEEE